MRIISSGRSAQPGATTARAGRLFALAAVTVALLFAAVVPAWAGGPDTGRYNCYHYGTYFAYITLKANGTYTFNGGGKGNWVYKPKTRRIIFETGSIPPWYGKRIHDYQGGTQFELHKGSGENYAICY
jgi:hypothetical protein